MERNTATRARRFHFAVTLALILAIAVSIAFVNILTGNVSAASLTPQGTAGCSQVLANSDFEGGGGWTEFSQIGASLISNFPPPSGAYHSGAYGAYLADYNNAHDYIAQQVTIPADATQATLTFWWQVETQESASGVYDSLTVTVDNLLEQVIATLGSISNLDAGATWQQTSFDLLAYRGQTIFIRFDARTDANRPTAFYLDDITLDICVPDPTPTPTATSTPTATPTPVPTATPTPVPPSGNVIMAIEPANSLVALSSQPFTVSVVISNVVDLGGFEFTLAFDPQIVQVSAVSLGPFPGSTGRSVSGLPAQIDNTAGTVKFGAFSFGSQPGPSGSGVIAQVAMIPQSAGTSPLTFVQSQVTNTSANILPLTTIGGTVTVAGCSPYDVDCDGDVDVLDIMQVASRWGCQQGNACYDARYDLDGNGQIDILDIMQVAAHWGCTNADTCYWGGSAPFTTTTSVDVSIPAVKVPRSSGAFSLPIQVSGAQNLGAAEITLTYDPAIVQVVDAKPGGFLAQNGRQETMLPPKIDNDAGRVTLGAFTYGNAPGADGDGVLFYLWLKPVRAGQSEIAVERALLLDVQANEQPVTVQNGSIEVVPGQSMFIPLIHR